MSTRIVTRPAILDIKEYLQKVYKETKHIKRGNNASYIPELANVNPNIYGISLVDCDGFLYSVGDHKKSIAIESISKLFTLALALETFGIPTIFNKIGIHGSFLSFNSVIAADVSPSHTINPFVNQGAMAVTSLLYQKNQKNFFKNILNNMSAYANKKLSLNKKVYQSERATNSKNMSLAYLLKSYGRFYGDVKETVDVYTKQCSVNICSDDLAMMASVFANAGVHPITKKRLLSQKSTGFILRTLMSEGLYQYSDIWLMKCGVPAKSGVGGGLLIIIPGMCGIGIVSPPLDATGNSVKGIVAGERIVNRINYPLFHDIEKTCNILPFNRKNSMDAFKNQKTQKKHKQKLKIRLSVFKDPHLFKSYRKKKISKTQRRRKMRTTKRQSKLRKKGKRRSVSTRRRA